MTDYDSRASVMQRRLQSERLRLRLLEHDDLSFRVELINDPSVQATLNFDYPTSLARTELWFRNILIDDRRRDFTIWEINSSKRIGFGGLIQIERTVPKAELYVFLDKSFWGSGYGRESWELITRYGMEELRLRKVYAYQLINNEASQNITEALGWQREGLLRQDVLSHGQLQDRYIVSILRAEWQDNIRTKTSQE